MKKLWFVLLAVAGLALLGCPSPVEEYIPPDSLENPDYKLVNGIYNLEFTGVSIQNGNTYEVIIDIEELDDNLGGCHFKGQLFYTMNGQTWLLAGTQNAKPQNIARKGKKYRIELTAGDFGSDGSSANAAKGGYSVPAAGAATTPNGAKQIFRLIAQTPNWYSFGVAWGAQEQDSNNARDNWDVDYYADGITSGINGSITVRAKPNINYTDGSAVEVNDGKDAAGKGNIIGEEYIKLKEAPANSVLRVNCTANVVTTGGGGSSAQPGWGIAEFGTNMDKDKIRGQNINVDLTIPRVWEGSDVTANNNFPFYVDILIDDILSASEPDWTFVNVYNGGKIISMTIRVPTT